MGLFESLGRHLKSGALDELTLTTNGSQLPRHAEGALRGRRASGSTSPSTPAIPRNSRRSPGGARLDQVLEGIEAARAAGLKVKINTVALRGVNEDEIEDLIEWCAADGHDITFIETMPLGDIDGDRTEHYLPLSLVRAQLRKRWTLDESDHRTGGPARYVTVRETGQRIGFITPLTHNFCESCNRVRLTCTGTLYMCLGQEDAADLRTPLPPERERRGAGRRDPRGDRTQAQGPRLHHRPPATRARRSAAT